MAERRVKGKVVPIIQEEVDLMVSRFNQGRSWRTVAREVERHWQTAEKYVRRELVQREGKELRREALRQAVLLHHQDFPRSRKSWGALPPARPTDHRAAPWVSARESPPAPERRDRLFRDTLVPKAEQGFQAAQRQYITGRGTFLQVIDAQRTLLDLRLSWARARADRGQAWARIEQTVGGVPAAGAPDRDPGGGDTPAQEETP